MIQFTVYGIPQPQGSKKGFVVQKNGKKPRAVVVDDNKKTLKDWRTDVAAAAQQYRPPELYQRPVHIMLAFGLPRPKSVSVKKRPMPIVKPDLDKLIRAVLDALKGRVYQDDAQVVSVTAGKYYCPNPGVSVKVWEDLISEDLPRLPEY